MKDNRRNFLKLTSLTGLGLAGGVVSGFSKEPAGVITPSEMNNFGAQQFNMSGYAAPKIETVRVGFIGLGQRGPTHLNAMTKLDGVSIVGLCDTQEASVNKAQKLIEKSGQKPTLYFGDKDAWKKLCDRKDVDLIYIATPWALHVPMAVYAMEQGKHVAIEVPGS